MKVTLDKESHIYTVEGKGQRPSVSSVLDIYFPPPVDRNGNSRYAPGSAERGTNRHAWYHAIVSGAVIKNEPDEAIAAEVAGFRKFMAEVKPVYISGEVPYHCEELDYCGMPDLVCEIGGRLSVVDFKPPTAYKRWLLQTAAYQVLLHANKVLVLDRYVLRVLPNDYRLVPHKDAQDISTWRLLVAAYRAAGAYK